MFLGRGVPGVGPLYAVGSRRRYQAPVPSPVVVETDVVYGVDLAVGAADAGDGTWLTAARPTEAGLRVRRCRPAADFLGCTPDRESTLAALGRFVRSLEAGAVVGVDCPLGLPGDLVARLVGAVDWQQFLSAFPRSFAGPDDLEAACSAWAREHRGQAYLLRQSEAAASAQCAYGFIGAHLTYHGIEGFLEPVWADVAVAPMDMPGGDRPEKPVLMEAYPAGALDAYGLPREGYAGDTATGRRRRRRCLEGLPVAVPEPLREGVVGDAGADALDSVVAAETAARAAREGIVPGDVAREDWALEGYAYT